MVLALLAMVIVSGRRNGQGSPRTPHPRPGPPEAIVVKRAGLTWNDGTWTAAPKTAANGTRAGRAHLATARR
jgi:hypothetical protein